MVSCLWTFSVLMLDNQVTSLDSINHDLLLVICSGLVTYFIRYPLQRLSIHVEAMYYVDPYMCMKRTEWKFFSPKQVLLASQLSHILHKHQVCYVLTNIQYQHFLMLYMSCYKIQHISISMSSRISVLFSSLLSSFRLLFDK